MQLKTKVVFTREGWANAGGDIAATVAGMCVEVDAHVGENDVMYQEHALQSHLVEHGLAVTGTVSYPAVIPGGYAYKAGCEDGVPLIHTDLGRITTGSLGISKGEGAGNALTVYEIRPSLSNVVVLFGMIQAYPEEWTPVKEACIDPNSVINFGDRQWHPKQIIIDHRAGTYKTGSYEIGTLVFPVGFEKVSKGLFSYSCTSDGSTIPLGV